MTITKDRKQSLIGDYRRKDNDTGSPEVQIALLTTHIGELTGHLRTHKKDYARRRPQAGRPPHNEGNADLAADGPADPAAVPRGLPRRGADSELCVGQRSPKRRRRAGDERGLRGPRPFAAAVSWADRVGADGAR